MGIPTRVIPSMPTLLVSLGTSPAIVPEAFLMPDVEFSAVHVLTTDSTEVDFILEWFAARAPQVDLTITRVDGFTDFRSEQEHFLFEEVLYRWWLDVGARFQRDATVPAAVPDAGFPAHHLPTPSHPLLLRPDLPYVCLSGGFKTMSAAMQKAAAVLGAAEVFHVLCNVPSGTPQPSTAEDIDLVRSENLLHWIKLGPESGWPQFHHDAGSDYPLEILRRDGPVQWARAADSRFRDRLREIVERSHNIAGAWDRLAELPFSGLAAWPKTSLDWLDQPVDPIHDKEWVASLPKVELHCHLGGFATHDPELSAVRAAASDPESLPPLKDLPLSRGWPLPDHAVDLDAYMHLGDNNGSALLKDPGCLRRQCELLYQHLQRQNVVCAEIRCSPANYADPSRGRSAWDVLSDMKDAFDNVAARFQRDRTVPAAIPDAGHSFKPVAARLEREGAVPAAVPDAGSSTPSPRLFKPFDRDALYTQSWRNLPHRAQVNATAFVTFRLADSLPSGRLEDWVRERELFLQAHPKPWPDETLAQYRIRFPERLDLWLDECHGECLLERDAVAAIVERALQRFDGERYILDAFVIMPNHVHALVKPLPGHTLETITRSWKSFSAKEINRSIRRTGGLWQKESFDRLVRSRIQLASLRSYIAGNPLKAGLQHGFIVGQGIGLLVGVEDNSRIGPQTARKTALRVLEPVATERTSDTRVATPFPCQVNLILTATRKDQGDYRSAIARHLALAITAAQHWTTGCRVVGVDLAGFEHRDSRAALFATDFEPVHRVGLAVTVHAGENDDAEGIWQAVFKLNARRLGHALRLEESPDLLRAVADRGIGIEMCPYANYQIVGFPLLASAAGTRAASGTAAATVQSSHRLAATYPLKRYLDAGVRVTVNTDNIGISAASLSQNLLLAAKLCPGVTRMDLLRLQQNAVDAAFLPATLRLKLRRQVEVNLPCIRYTAIPPQ